MKSHTFHLKSVQNCCTNLAEGLLSSKARFASSFFVLCVALLFLTLGSQKTFAQGTVISTTTPTAINANAVLDLQGTKALLLPRLSSSAGTTAGLFYYDTDDNFLYYRNNSAWVSVLVSPMTTAGDIIYGGASGVATRLATGTSGQVLKCNGASAPSWTTQTQYNQSVTSQGAGFASNTYLTGSSIAIPSGSLKVGTRYHLVFDVSKTGAGTATPIIYIRFGTAGTTADAARLTFTFPNGTTNADVGTFEVWVTFRTVGSGATAIMQGTAQCRHTATATTGLINLQGSTLQVTSAGFDSTPAGSIIGASVNGGTGAVWTVQLVQAELSNLQ